MDDFFDAIMEYRNLKEDVLFPFQNLDESYYAVDDQIDNKRRRFEELQEIIGNAQDDVADHFRNQLTRAIEIIIPKIEREQNMGFPLSRNQGLIIDNYIYGKVIGVLRSGTKNGYGISYPDFYYERQGDFDSGRLLTKLLDYRQRLGRARFESYFEFEEMAENLIDEIRQLWEEDNQGLTEP